MRRLPGKPAGEESPELAAQVQLAVERREIAIRLFEELGEEPPRLSIDASTSDDPEELGLGIRRALDIEIDEQLSWADPYEALRGWRSKLERFGILVFQIPRVSMDEMRGFSLSPDPLPIIGVNTKDSPRGRIFTIFHEFTHILLNDDILHAPGTNWFQLDPDLESEFFANNVSAATLVPQGDFVSAAAELDGLGTGGWTDRKMTNLSRRYEVSKSVIVRRLRKFDLISPQAFAEFRADYDQFEPQPRGSGGGGNFYLNKTAHLGTLIPQMAFRAYYDDKVTSSDLSSLFGMQVKSLGKFEERIFGANYGFEIT